VLCPYFWSCVVTAVHMGDVAVMAILDCAHLVYPQVEEDPATAIQYSSRGLTLLQNRVQAAQAGVHECVCVCAGGCFGAKKKEKATPVGMITGASVP
jgi:hypothetical protein